MRRRLAAAVAGGTLVFCVSASASSLGGLDVSNLASGAGVVVACDDDGLSTSYTTSAGKVTAVTVSGIADPGCEGARLSLSLVTNGKAQIGSGGPVVVPFDEGTADDSVTVPVATRPDVSAIAGVHIVMEGP